MTKEYVLDIGIGEGGEYLLKDRENIQRFGIDTGIWDLFHLGRDYPSVIPVQADAERLPFRTDAFSQIEITLPEKTLLLPGLEIDHFALLEKYREEYKKIYPMGWYREFSRLLIRNGTLLLRGDVWLNLPSIQQCSASFFKIVSTRKLSLQELEDLGTRASGVLIRRYYTESSSQQRSDFEDGLIEIIMTNQKDKI
jgi:hypothetical protein